MRKKVGDSLGLYRTDVAHLLAEQNPDIVSVCTPDATHADILYTVLKTTGVRAVLAEKPLALDVRQARDVFALRGTPSQEKHMVVHGILKSATRWASLNQVSLT